MNCQPYENLLPGAKTAVLYIHGILGTPNHFAPFFPLAQGCSQCSILLEGHGGDARDFSRASMDCWKNQVHSKVLSLLQTHQTILIAAHSMGTLFAISEALQFPQRVKGLFLLAAPLSICPQPRLAVNCWKVFWNQIPPEDVQAQAAREAYGIGQDYRVWHYLGWIPRYLELFAQIHRINGQLSDLRVPVVDFQSAKDEMVHKSAIIRLQQIPAVQVEILPESSHFYYSQADHCRLLGAFSEFLHLAAEA